MTVSMLNGEFSERMFHESYSYEFPQYDPTEEDDENGLTGAALGWLYCEATKEYSNHDDLFTAMHEKYLNRLHIRTDTKSPIHCSRYLITDTCCFFGIIPP